MKRILALLAVLVVWSTSAFGQDAVERITTLVDTYGDKTPPLHLAVFRGETETVKTLIENGEDVNYFWVQHRYTPLELATILGNLDIIRLLLDNGANPDRLVDGYLDMPALMYADNVEVAKILIDHGADIDGQSVLFGNMPLHAASYRGKKDVVQVLLDHGADVNAKDIDGRTPLDIAIDRGRTEIAALLREHGGVATK